MHKLLITGSTGFIGRFLCSDLLDYEIIKYRRDNDLIIKEEYAVIHLAGLAHNSHKSDLRKVYKVSNVDLTKSVFDSFLNSNAKIFIFFSTSKVSGSKNGLLVEDLVSSDLNVYSESKLLAEKYILSQKATSKKVYILRPAVVVGPELKGNLKTLVNYVNFRLPWFFNSFNNSMTILDMRNLSFIIKQILSEENKIPPDIYQIGNYQPIEVKNLIKSMQLKRRSKSCLLSIPKNFIYLIFKIGNVLNLPFLNLKTLDKLVLDSQVSTKKISKYIPELPFNNDDTINKFL